MKYKNLISNPLSLLKGKGALFLNAKDIKAFSIIEISLFMVVVGILLSGSISIFLSMYKNTKEKENVQLLSSIENELVSISSQSMCLPFDTNSYPYMPQSFYPNKDAFNKELVYIPAPELINGNRNELCQNINNTKINPCICQPRLNINNICSRSKTSLRVLFCKTEDCSTYQEVKDVGFVIISGGANKNIQTSVEYGDFVTVRVYLPGTVVDSFNLDESVNEPFDDNVKFLTLNNLQRKIFCENTKSKLSVLTESLPVIYKSSGWYEAKIYVDGGVPKIQGDKKEYRWYYNGVLPFTVSPQSGDWSSELKLSISGRDLENLAVGTYMFRVDVEDLEGNKVYRNYSLTVNP